jgi:hypothetical protein
MPSHLFKSFWLQRELSPLEHLCLKSFIAHGHRFVLYSYNDVGNLPEGCDLEDARQILPEDSVFAYRSSAFAGSVAAFANLFRYKLLHERGGWWVDTDTLCLKADIPETPYAFAKIDAEQYANGVLKAPDGSALTELALARAQSFGSEVEFLGNGPRLLTQLIAELSLEQHAWKTEDFLPLSWGEALGVLDPDRRDEIAQRAANSTFLHFWTQMLRIYNVLKTVRPPEGSFLDGLYEKYEVAFPASPRYTWDDLQGQVQLQAEHWALHEEIAQLRSESEAAEKGTPPRDGWRGAARPILRALAGVRGKQRA